MLSHLLFLLKLHGAQVTGIFGRENTKKVLFFPGAEEYVKWEITQMNVKRNKNTQNVVMKWKLRDREGKPLNSYDIQQSSRTQLTTCLGKYCSARVELLWSAVLGG